MFSKTNSVLTKPGNADTCIIIFLYVFILWYRLKQEQLKLTFCCYEYVHYIFLQDSLFSYYHPVVLPLTMFKQYFLWSVFFSCLSKKYIAVRLGEFPVPRSFDECVSAGRDPKDLVACLGQVCIFVGGHFYLLSFTMSNTF